MQGIRIFMLCMMMRLTALMTYCWMACVLASCVGSASSDAIEVNLLHTDVDTIAYSAFVDSIEYIPLETTEECWPVTLYGRQCVCDEPVWRRPGS